MEMNSIWGELEPSAQHPSVARARDQRAAKVTDRAGASQSTSVPWSYSRRNVFERCPRQYYYQYYGAGARTARNEPNKDMLHLLKGLTNRHERVGELLHLGIATTLRKAQQGLAITPSRLQSWLCGMLDADIAYSRTDPDGLNPSEVRYPPKLLLEFHYRYPDADTLLTDADARLRDALEAFATAPEFEPFRRAGSMVGSLIEYRLKIPTLPVRVEGKLDLAYADDPGDVVVVDWKLGAADGAGDGSLQLAAYALGATSHFAVTAEHVRVVKAHLSTREVVEYVSNERTLGLARTRILQDIERMSAMHRYGQEGIVTAFTPTPSPRLCAQCAFQGLCPVGRELLQHA